MARFHVWCRLSVNAPRAEATPVTVPPPARMPRCSGKCPQMEMEINTHPWPGLIPTVRLIKSVKSLAWQSYLWKQEIVFHQLNVISKPVGELSSHSLIRVDQTLNSANILQSLSPYQHQHAQICPASHIPSGCRLPPSSGPEGKQRGAPWLGCIANWARTKTSEMNSKSYARSKQSGWPGTRVNKAGRGGCGKLTRARPSIPAR